MPWPGVEPTICRLRVRDSTTRPPSRVAWYVCAQTAVRTGGLGVWQLAVRLADLETQCQYPPECCSPQPVQTLINLFRSLYKAFQSLTLPNNSPQQFSTFLKLKIVQIVLLESHISHFMPSELLPSSTWSHPEMFQLLQIYHFSFLILGITCCGLTSD